MAHELDVIGAAGKGALSGASTGATIGSIIPGVGTAIGAGVGAVVGGVGAGIKANKASQASQAVSAQDPQELARLAEIDRIRRSIGAGTDPLTQQAIQRAQQTGASTQQRIARVTGGDVGSTIAGLTRAQRGTQAATNQALAQSQNRLPFFENLGQQLRTRVSQRQLEIGLLNRAQAQAENAQTQKAASANISGAVGLLGNVLNAGQGVNEFQVPEGGGDFIANQPGVDQLDLSQTGAVPTSQFTQPGQVNIPIQSSLPTGSDFQGIIPEQNQITIANQGLNSPVQQVPLVNPLNQGQFLLNQLGSEIQANPTGIPSGRQNLFNNRLIELGINR